MNLLFPATRWRNKEQTSLAGFIPAFRRLGNLVTGTCTSRGEVDDEAIDAPDDHAHERHAQEETEGPENEEQAENLAGGVTLNSHLFVLSDIVG